MKSSFCRFVLALLISFSIASCSTYTEFGNHIVADADSTAGSVFLSLTRSGARDIPFYLRYRGIDDNNSEIVGALPILGLDDWISQSTRTTTSKGDFEGRLIVLDLPVGKYEFYTFAIEQGYKDASWSSGKEFSYPFESHEAVLEYAGNVHIWSKETQGELDIAFEHHHSDERSRDAARLQKKYPHFTRLAYSTFTSNLAPDVLNGALTDAERHLLSFEPQDAESHKNRAAFFIRERNFESAEFHAAEAIKLDPTLSDAYLYRAIVMLNKRSLNQAEGYLNYAIRNDERNVLAYVLRALIKKYLNYHDEALEDYNRAVSIDAAFVKRLAKNPNYKVLFENL